MSAFFFKHFISAYLSTNREMIHIYLSLMIVGAYSIIQGDFVVFDHKVSL